MELAECGDNTEPLAEHLDNRSSKQDGIAGVWLESSANYNCMSVEDQNGAEEQRILSPISVTIRYRMEENISPEEALETTAVDNDEVPDKIEQESSNKVDTAPKKISDGSKKHAASRKSTKKRGVYISYAPEADFSQKRFIAETVKQLKDIGYWDDIWYDKDELQRYDSPFCVQQRLEVAEKCRAAIIILSQAYMQSHLAQYEVNVLLNREHAPKESVSLFTVKFDDLGQDLPVDLAHLLPNCVDLSLDSLKRTSFAEKASCVVGALSESLEKFAVGVALHVPTPVKERSTEPEFLKKAISSWNIYDVQDWLCSLKIHERFVLSFEENCIDGYLLLSLSEEDMLTYLNVDNRIVRRKLLQNIKGILEREEKDKANWFLNLRATVRTKEECIYLIYDPADSRLANNVKNELKDKKVTVYRHEKLGQSKEEFLQSNAPHLAAAKHIIAIMTTGSAVSPFLYNEVVMATWLGKPFITLMFQNSWQKMRQSVRAVLGIHPAIDFERSLFHEGMDVLMYKIRPPQQYMHTIKLEQTYLDRMVEGLKTLRELAQSDSEKAQSPDPLSHPRVFISYHWDSQMKVQLIMEFLEMNGIECWMDINHIAKRPVSQTSIRGQQNMQGVAFDDLKCELQRNMKSASVVLCCVTPKYILSDNCVKDLTLAESLQKPVLPVMLQWLHWPPDGLPMKIKALFAPVRYIDMSNDKLFKKNMRSVLDQLMKQLNPPIPYNSPSPNSSFDSSMM